MMKNLWKSDFQNFFSSLLIEKIENFLPKNSQKNFKFYVSKSINFSIYNEISKKKSKFWNFHFNFLWKSPHKINFKLFTSKKRRFTDVKCRKKPGGSFQEENVEHDSTRYTFLKSIRIMRNAQISELQKWRLSDIFKIRENPRKLGSPFFLKFLGL